MTHPLKTLHAFWFAAAPADRLAVLRIAVAGFALWYLGVRIELLAEVVRGDPALFEPVGVARLLGSPLAPSTADALVLATLLANVAFLIGWQHRVSGPIFAGLLLFTLCYRNSWSMIYHTDNVMVFHVLILGLTRSADALSIDAWLKRRAGGTSWQYGWPVRLMCAVTLATYFLAGVAKILGPLGWGWATGEAMLGQVLVDALRKDLLGSGAPALVYSLHDEIWLFAAVGVGTFILELGAPLALAHRRAGQVWSLAAFGMHWGIWAIMGILFRYQLAGIIFLPFFPVERIAVWIRRMADRRGRRSSRHQAAPALAQGAGLREDGLNRTNILENAERRAYGRRQ